MTDSFFSSVVSWKRKSSGYVKRGFVLVVVYILLQQVYYKMRKVQKEPKSLTIACAKRFKKMEGLEQKYVALERQHAALEERIADLQLLLDIQHKENEEYKESLGFCYKLLWSLTQEVRVSYDRMTYVHVPIRHLAKVYIRKGESNKLFYAKLVEAKEVLIDVNSLSSLENLYPSILIKNKNDELVNMLAFKGLVSKADKWYLDLFGTDLAEVNKEQSTRILEYRAALLLGMDKAKELLQGNRNLKNDEEK